MFARILTVAALFVSLTAVASAQSLEQEALRFCSATQICTNRLVQGKMSVTEVVACYKAIRMLQDKVWSTRVLEYNAANQVCVDALDRVTANR